MAVYDSKHCMLPEDPVLFTISHLVLNCGKLSYISWYITTFPVVFEPVFYQMKNGTYFPLCTEEKAWSWVPIRVSLQYHTFLFPCVSMPLRRVSQGQKTHRGLPKLGYRQFPIELNRQERVLENPLKPNRVKNFRKWHPWCYSGRTFHIYYPLHWHSYILIVETSA